MKKILPLLALAGLLLGSVLFSSLQTSGSGGSGEDRTAASDSPISRSGFLLNTYVTVTIYDSRDTSLLDRSLEICEEYEALLSKTVETSEIYRMNHRSAEEQSFTVSDDTAALLEEALKYCELSEGAFDITIEPVSSLWDFTGEAPALPDAEEIAEAVRKVGYQKLVLSGNTVTFLSLDTTIDLGAVAKGYIADRIKEYLTRAGVRSAVIDLGGNVLCIGSRPSGEPFQIGLRMPFAGRSETFGALAIRDLSVVVSGVYERHFILNGKNYHHILDPSTGWPYDNGLTSVAIISRSSADGDALSTTCFALGLDKGMELINSLEEVYAVFTDEDQQVYYSDGAKEFLLPETQQ